ncbi:hypothetical protein ACG83_10555 [Frankia sp. R43]|nr:hypothetical protein ACG83_10555 [Frankia sp. R43]
MTFHPFSGLFAPGEGPGLHGGVDDGVCAYEHSGRWRSTSCRSTDTVAVVAGAGPQGDEPLLCRDHVDAWAQTPEARDGFHRIHEFELKTSAEDG